MALVNAGADLPPSSSSGITRVRQTACGIVEVDCALSHGLVADVKVYRHGQTVLLPEEEVGFTCVLLSGWMTASILLTHGKRQISEIYLKGDLVESTSESGKNQELLQAATDLSILTFRLPPLPEAVDRWPRFMSWLQDQRHRLRVLDVEHLAALGNCNAVQRMSWVLLRLARRTSRGNMGASTDFAFPLTQTDLADYLGMTPIHLNRTIRQLREADVAHFKNGHITIPDLKRLERQCVIIGPATDRIPNGLDRPFSDE